MNRETKIQKEILDYLNGLPNCKAIKIMSANEAGTPDIFCCYGGVMIVMEVKESAAAAHIAETKQLRQNMQLKQWGEAGAYNYYVWNLGMVKSIIGDIGKKL